MCERELYVGRLPLGVRPCELEAVFCEYGELIRCKVKQGNGMAYGFVEYVHRRDAEEAIRGQHGKDFNGEHLVVEWAQSPRIRYQDEHNHREGYSDDDKDYWRDESSSRYRSRSRSSCHCKRSSYSRKDRSRSRSRSPDETHRKARSRTYSLPAIAVLVLPLNELIDTE